MREETGGMGGGMGLGWGGGMPGGRGVTMCASTLAAAAAAVCQS